ncbi:DUF5067 domain-containing protein [Enterococcus rotai]|uniref:DUF5067 domain-containing protein n=1 Tax=Enterococcus rotai TaxID=118060 RepID=UPI0035C6B269
MKNRYLVGLFLLMGLFLLGACSMITDEKGSVSETSNTKKNGAADKVKKNDKLYGELARNVASPEMLKHSEQFNQTIHFVAQVEGEPQQIESKDDTLNGEWYISVFLMRNRNTPMYLNLSAIKKENWPKNGDILRIKGTPIGYLYTSFNNERLNLLDVEAKTIETIEFQDEDVPANKIIETEQYKIELTNTDILSDTFEEPCLLIYYNFKNKGEFRAISPLKTYFTFSQKNEVLATTILSSDNEQLDSKALNRGALEAGEEMLYYEAFKLVDTTTPVNLSVYDDEYNRLNYVEISVKREEKKGDSI